MDSYLLVGFSVGWLAQLDRFLPPGCVTVLEEPDIVVRRRVCERARAYRCVGHILLASYQQSAAFTDLADQAHERRRFTAVVPGLEYAVPAAALLAERWGLPGGTAAAASVLRDKLLLREAAARAGLRNPAWREVTGPDDIAAFARGRPVVVKPAGRQASLGVLLLDAGEDPEAAWREMITASEGALVTTRPQRWRYLAEERMSGPEYSVEALCRDGEVIFANCTEKGVFPGRHPVESRHLVPAPLPAATADGLRAATRTLIAATGFGTGVVHAEWLLADDGAPALVECAGRAPGDLIFELIGLAYGFDIYRAVLDLLAGRAALVRDHPRQAAAISFVAPVPGTVTGVMGLPRASGSPGVVRVDVSLSAGDRVTEPRSSWDRHGFVIACGASPDAARAQADEAVGAITVHTAPEDCRRFRG